MWRQNADRGNSRGSGVRGNAPFPWRVKGDNSQELAAPKEREFRAPRRAKCPLGDYRGKTLPKEGARKRERSGKASVSEASSPGLSAYPAPGGQPEASCR